MIKLILNNRILDRPFKDSTKQELGDLLTILNQPSKWKGTDINNKVIDKVQKELDLREDI